jgi:hypothetical protein
MKEGWPQVEENELTQPGATRTCQFEPTAL